MGWLEKRGGYISFFSFFLGYGDLMNIFPQKKYFIKLISFSRNGNFSRQKFTKRKKKFKLNT
jgi:hypothetical protein